MRTRGIVAWVAVAIGMLFIGQLSADEPNGEPAEKPEPAVSELPVRVVDADDQPVAGAKIMPWALRSSQGHGWWQKGDERAKVDPREVTTDAEGNATVLYPFFRDHQERTRVTQVSIWIDHPDFAYVDRLHIDVPLEVERFKFRLTRGVPLEVRPTIDGQPASLDNIYALWSDGRSWRPGVSPAKTAEGCLRIPAMRPGENSVLLVMLDGERATHFSKIVDFELTAGEPKRIDVPLKAALQVHGQFSADVPRPVRAGRIKTSTLQPMPENYDRVEWFSWAPVQADGTFTIAWPADEPMQLIALCEGFMAAAGKAPDCVKNPPEPDKDPYLRAQVFTPDGKTPVEVLDDAAGPLPGDGGRRRRKASGGRDGDVVAERWLVEWRFTGVLRSAFPRRTAAARRDSIRAPSTRPSPTPTRPPPSADGTAKLELPIGKERLAIVSEVYELPVFLGRRDIKIHLNEGDNAAVVRLQPRGTDKLGEWDKLAGVVFGCSTREGRRICALPGVTKKMDEFAERFRVAKNQRNPQMLAEAYMAVADAFIGVGDVLEAAKWRQKADEQAEKAKAAGARGPIASRLSQELRAHDTAQRQSLWRDHDGVRDTDDRLRHVCTVHRGDAAAS